MARLDKKRRVLIISFLFAPLNNIGAVRISKFVKYLPLFGWEPVILTVDSVRGGQQTLPLEVDKANVIRTPYFDIGPTMYQALTTGKAASHTKPPKLRHASLRRLIYKLIHFMRPVYMLPILKPLTMDPIGWYPLAVRKGLEIAAKHNIDIIYSTYSPLVPHLVASRLHKKTGIPWVAEFRDLWSLIPYSDKFPPFQFFQKLYEKKIMKGCCLLISVSKPWTQQLGAFHSKRAITIPNGFDDDDYTEAIPLTRKFTITYTGFVYPVIRDPTPLFEAVVELWQEAKIHPDDLEVRFFGSNVSERITPLIKKYGLNELVKVYGFVPFYESIRRQKESTTLLWLGWNDERDKGTYSAKIFEYLGARRPILAIGVKDGEVDKLLKESGSGILANEVEQIKGIIMKWVSEFKQNRAIVSYYNPKQEIISRYTRREATAKLAKAFDEIIVGKNE